MSQRSPVVRPSKLLGIAPLFLVADVVKAATYYRDILGFEVKRIWGNPPRFVMPQRDGFILMLSQVDEAARIRPNGSDGETWDAHLWVTDADALFEEFEARGADVVYPPRDELSYGNREFAVRDSDGYVLAFAHDITARR